MFIRTRVLVCMHHTAYHYPTQNYIMYIII